jgi:hypothetical protein
MTSGDDFESRGSAPGAGDPPRLADDPRADPWTVGLLQSTGPYKSPPGRKQRVLLSLGRSNLRRAPLVLRPAIVLAVLIGCGAFASAAIGPWRGWIGRVYERLAPSSLSSRVAAAPAPEQVRTHRPATAHALALATSPAESTPALAAAVAPPAPAVIAIAPPHAHHAAAPAPGSQPPQAETQAQGQAPGQVQGEEETLAVLAAMRALRLDHDPIRARALLARYLGRHPNGALAEEALALSIEAAVAHHDADAAALGARYLQRYPAGPFRTLALQAGR